MKADRCTDEHQIIEKVAKKLLSIENDERTYDAQSRKKQNADPYNVALRKKYDKIWKRLSKDE